MGEGTVASALWGSARRPLTGSAPPRARRKTAHSPAGQAVPVTGGAGAPRRRRKMQFDYDGRSATPATAMQRAEMDEAPNGWVVTRFSEWWTFGPEIVGFDFTQPFRLCELDAEKQVGSWSYCQEKNDGDPDGESWIEYTNLRYFVRPDGTARIETTYEGTEDGWDGTFDTVLKPCAWVLEMAWTSFGAPSGVRVVPLG